MRRLATSAPWSWRRWSAGSSGLGRPLGWSWATTSACGSADPHRALVPGPRDQGPGGPPNQGGDLASNQGGSLLTVSDQTQLHLIIMSTRAQGGGPAPYRASLRPAPYRLSPRSTSRQPRNRPIRAQGPRTVPHMIQHGHRAHGSSSMACSNGGVSLPWSREQGAIGSAYMTVHVIMHLVDSVRSQVSEKDLIPGGAGISDDQVSEAAPMVRALVVSRLEKIWRACEPHILLPDPEPGEPPRKPDPRFIEAGIRVNDRLIALYGLLKPQTAQDPESGAGDEDIQAAIDRAKALEARLRPQ